MDQDTAWTMVQGAERTGSGGIKTRCGFRVASYETKMA
jgi:hypothetical protein